MQRASQRTRSFGRGVNKGCNLSHFYANHCQNNSHYCYIQMEYTNLVTVVNRIISIKSMFCLQISLLNSHVSTLAKMLLQSFLQKCFSLLYHGKIKIFNFFFFYKPLCENLFDFKVKTTMSQNSLSIWH